jgi:hypothetical protein
MWPAHLMLLGLIILIILGEEYQSWSSLKGLVCEFWISWRIKGENNGMLGNILGNFTATRRFNSSPELLGLDWRAYFNELDLSVCDTFRTVAGQWRRRGGGAVVSARTKWPAHEAEHSCLSTDDFMRWYRWMRASSPSLKLKVLSINQLEHTAA